MKTKTRLLALVAALLVSPLRSVAQTVIGFSDVESITGPTTTLAYVGFEYSGDTLKVSTFDKVQSFALSAPNVELTFKQGKVEVLGESFDFAFGPNIIYVTDVFGGVKVDWLGKVAEPGFSIVDSLPPPEFIASFKLDGPGDAIVWAVSPVPESEQVAMASALGLLGFGLWRRRKLR